FENEGFYGASTAAFEAIGLAGPCLLAADQETALANGICLKEAGPLVAWREAIGQQRFAGIDLSIDIPDRQCQFFIIGSRCCYQPHDEIALGGHAQRRYGRFLGKIINWNGLSC